ncbi:MAG: helix-turn-helix transcriptional regulator [Clostridia bacterium]|nr:helix-turn-helix transcriptional regulator [Clostridia bacterium]
MDIGCKLKQARNEKGLTQEQAAELLNVSRQTISNWENSKSYLEIPSFLLECPLELVLRLIAFPLCFVSCTASPYFRLLLLYYH